MSDEPQSWFRSKVVRFMFMYWAVIILLTYAVEWLGRHGPALHVAFTLFVIGILVYGVLRIASWRRRNRMW